MSFLLGIGGVVAIAVGVHLVSEKKERPDSTKQRQRVRATPRWWNVPVWKIPQHLRERK
jgi:hypothetical protein